jgi:hypothetical protein
MVLLQEPRSKLEPLKQLQVGELDLVHQLVLGHCAVQLLLHPGVVLLQQCGPLHGGCVVQGDCHGPGLQSLERGVLGLLDLPHLLQRLLHLLLLGQQPATCL